MKPIKNIETEGLAKVIVMFVGVALLLASKWVNL